MSEFAPAGEHEYKAALHEDIFYPDHTPRTESPTFRKTKHDGSARGDVCAISGQSVGLEYHHVTCEEAFTNGVDWHVVKGIALGTVTTMPVLDIATDRPTGTTFPVEQSLIWALIQMTKARGFDWDGFDPEKPEMFVDSYQNMLVLHEKFHRSTEHGIHENSFPIWVFQAFPRKAGFVYSADELLTQHKQAAA